MLAGGGKREDDDRGVGGRRTLVSGRFNRFASEVAGTFATRVCLFAAGVAGSVLIARALGPEGKGVLAAVLLVPNTLIIVGMFGVGTATTYLIGRGCQLGYIVRRLSRIGLVLGAAYLVSALAGFLLGREVLFSQASIAAFALAALVCPMGLWLRYAEYVFLGTGDIRLRNVALVAQGVAQIVLLVFLLLWPLGLGVEGAILGRLLSTIVALGLAVFWIRGLLRERRQETTVERFAPMPAASSGLLWFGFRAYASTVVMFLNYRADLLMLRAFRSDAEVGIYSVSVGLAELLWYLPGAFGMVLLSRAARSTSEGLGARSTRLMLALSLLIAGVVAVVAPWAIGILYGRAYAGSVEPLRILLAGVVAVTIFKILNPDLAGRGRPGAGSLVFLGALAVNLGLNALWIPLWGATGAAWASTVSYALGSTVFLGVYSRITSTPLRDLVVLRSGDLRDAGEWLKRIAKKGAGR